MMTEKYHLKREPYSSYYWVVVDTETDKIVEWGVQEEKRNQRLKEWNEKANDGT